MSNVHEQHELEALKAWWKSNGMAVVTGGLLALSTVFGWQAWQNYQQAQSEAASGLYEALRAQQAQADFGVVSREARRLMVEFDDTPYAVGAAFMLASHAAGKGEWTDAEESLNWVVQHSSQVHWRAVASLRLARVQMEQDKQDQALKTLDAALPSLPAAFVGMAHYLRGMVMLQQGREAEARQAFAQAEKDKEMPGSMRSLAQLWSDDLNQGTP